MKTSEALAWANGTQSELARRLGIAQPSVCIWGEYPPPMRQMQIEKLSKGLLKAEIECWKPKKVAA